MAWNDKLRVLTHGRLPGAANMAVDDVLLEGDGAAPITLRFYGWRRPTVSLGYAQPWRDGYDPTLARRWGVDVVRRRTGGRAVLHADEITYSVAAPSQEGPLRGGINATYAVIAEGLAEGFRRLGVDARIERGRGRRGVEREGPGACFAVRARHEIVVGGKKLVGSAQRRAGGRLLQHGSILIAEPDPRLWSVLGPTGRSAAEASVGLASVARAGTSRRSVMAHLARSLAGRLGLVVAPSALSGIERRAVARCRQTYASRELTFRR